MNLAHVLERERPDLIVESSHAHRLTRDHHDAAKYFERVTVGSFADLQTLGFAPKRLTEARVRQAIGDDDAEALRAMHESTRLDPHEGCSCSSAQQSAAPIIRNAYDRIRPQQHPHLARLFSGELGVHFQFDAIPVRVLAGALAQMQILPLLLELFLVRDIVVQRDATLTIDATVSLLRARDVKLFVGAKLVTTTPYLKVICRSVKGDLT